MYNLNGRELIPFLIAIYPPPTQSPTRPTAATRPAPNQLLNLNVYRQKEETILHFSFICGYTFFSLNVNAKFLLKYASFSS